jgi:hypothetical protein
MKLQGCIKMKKKTCRYCEQKFGWNPIMSADNKACCSDNCEKWLNRIVEKEVGTAKEAAKKVIAAAEKDLGSLSYGEKSDLLQDQDVAQDWKHAHKILDLIEYDEKEEG